MELLFWITIGFVTIGFVVLVIIKRKMEIKLAFVNNNWGSENDTTKSLVKRSAKSIIWWIVGTAAWGIVSMFLIVWWFSINK